MSSDRRQLELLRKLREATIRGCAKVGLEAVKELQANVLERQKMLCRHLMEGQSMTLHEAIEYIFNKCTCANCNCFMHCEYAFDMYNFGGDCLAAK